MSKIKVRLRFPKLKVQDTLVDIAEKDIIPDIQTRMTNQKDLDNQSYGSLAVSTKRARNRKKTGFSVLLDTKQLSRSFRQRKRNNDAVVIKPSKPRKGKISNSELTDILQNEGVRSKQYGLRKFNFFGISKDAEKLAMERMKKTIDKAIKRGERRTNI